MKILFIAIFLLLVGCGSDCKKDADKNACCPNNAKCICTTEFTKTA